MKNDRTERDGSATPVPQNVSLQRRWAHEYALTQPGYDELPCPTENDGATLITQPGTPLPPKFYRFPTPGDEDSRPDPYTPASTPRTAMDLDSQIFCLRIRLALFDAIVAAGGSHEQYLRVVYDSMTDEQFYEFEKGYDVPEFQFRVPPSAVARYRASQENDEVMQEDDEDIQEDGEISLEDGEISLEDGEVLEEDGPSEMPDADVAMADVPTIRHTDFWVPVQIAGQKRKAPSLLEDPLDAEQPDEQTGCEDKFEAFTFDEELGGD
ncbi:unnamed protein product [Clonostachys solani]|uniref:Uncharacterized protein n=1 Tax=Clonostachys solani TaxID=160281 RepID=A0A9N9W8G6_9HYPO|nr:unnamed protein product [Clonostachys solani]